MLRAGDLKDLVRIERPVADESFTGAGSGSWALVDEVWAEVRDLLPSRGERLADGINLATRPARVRMRYRDDITSAMRIVFGSRVMQIVTQPARLMAGDGIEFMVLDFSTAGGGA